jgi:hypothetical protein
MSCVVIINYGSEHRELLTAPKCFAYLGTLEQAQAKTCGSNHPSRNSGGQWRASGEF